LAQEKAITKPILGFDQSFLIKIKREGFHDLKTIVMYTTQLKKILDLINT